MGGGRGRGGMGGEGRGGRSHTDANIRRLAPPSHILTDSLSRADLCLNVDLPTLLAEDVTTRRTAQQLLVALSTHRARLLQHRGRGR